MVGYDRPRVLVFRNAVHLSEFQLAQMLTRLQEAEKEDSLSTALMLSPEALGKQREGGTFSDIVNRDGWTNDVPVLAWLLVVELIYLLDPAAGLFHIPAIARPGGSSSPGSWDCWRFAMSLG